jgi:DNA-binding LacI/PurR family transcriptional regulator
VLRPPPSVIVPIGGSHGQAGVGVLGALRELGVEAPGDVAVAGFDDIPFAALSAPALTTASHPVGRIAAAAATAILNRAAVSPETVFASELVRRESA